MFDKFSLHFLNVLTIANANSIHTMQQERNRHNFSPLTTFLEE